MFQFPGASIPIPAVVLVAFNLVQDGVNPGSGGIGIELLDHFVCSFPSTGKG
jgi:hypothetical protein